MRELHVRETIPPWNGPRPASRGTATSRSPTRSSERDRPTCYLQGYCSQVDLNWESPYLARFLRGLSRHGRLIVMDRRGWGCSERFTPGYVPDVDVLTDDVLAVLAAVDSQRASLVATYESAIVA